VNWLSALDLLLELDADTFVPGHGPLGRREHVEALRDYWRWLDDGVGRHHAAGRSAVQAARALIREPEFARFRGWVCPERIALNATTLHRLRAGKGPVPATPPARARLFATVAALGRELDAAAR
jgi:glyoxylase-like metal-dependent hydrolase (beta-lactamase superfamily II)